MIFNTLVSFLALALAATSTPILQPQQLDVITPHITSPTEKDSWTPGSIQTVTWETQDIPPAFVNNSGMILLGHMGTTYDSKGRPQTTENLNTTCPLANHFLIGAGKVNVTVPLDTPPRDTYIIVLFGDSGNTSPQFKIQRK
ncbi:hypothetical protein C8R44DRAFT_771476 [Mycena epipterygia]|nr:hypothetical protein C8R44DRAFT_771476 [Mycena epipterygia]